MYCIIKISSCSLFNNAFHIILSISTLSNCRHKFSYCFKKSNIRSVEINALLIERGTKKLPKKKNCEKYEIFYCI